MPLTDIAIRKVKPADKDQWLADGNGLRLLVKKSGSKYWRFKYRFGAKQKTLALGIYPETSLKEARNSVLDAKVLLKSGIDPSQERKKARRAISTSIEQNFEALAEDWWQQQRGTWTDAHANRVWSRLRDNAFPVLGEMPMDQIKPQDVIGVIRGIEKRDALDVAGRVLQDIRRVCRYSVQIGVILHNPANELSDVLKARKTSHRASLSHEELPQFLRHLEHYDQQGRILTKLAIKLLVVTFVRPGELRGARWDEFNLDEKLWRIPASRMKMGADHIVPLSVQALAILDELEPISGRYELVFPSERSRQQSMSDNTMRRAIFKLGYDGSKPNKSRVTPHGFRATASSLLNEKGFNPDAIERQLSHMERNGVRAAYTHHARYLDERREIMQWWGDFCYANKL